MLYFSFLRVYYKSTYGKVKTRIGFYLFSVINVKSYFVNSSLIRICNMDEIEDLLLKGTSKSFCTP